MTIKETIQLARDNGWEADLQVPQNSFMTCFIDPKFWQALGRGFHWKPSIARFGMVMPEWNYKWLQFIQHLASGHSIESFFQGY